MTYKQQSDLLAGPIGALLPGGHFYGVLLTARMTHSALLKMRLTRNLHEIADDAVQVSLEQRPEQESRC